MRSRFGLLSVALCLVGLVSPPTGADGSTIESIAEKIQDLKQKEQTQWRTIPWARSLMEARALSRREGRPLFMFTYGGDLDTGRC
ncbi:MAG TPA: hypothetical protein VKJ47_09970 [Candidatus Binatia bacterium]|nr:hypothetical protein [Candidatus Binatia bacterium]